MWQHNTNSDLNVEKKRISLFNFYIILHCRIDGLHLTSRRPCWRCDTKEYVISSIVGSSKRGVADVPRD